MKHVTRTRYPKADVKGFLNRIAWIGGCLIFLHWLPDVAALIHPFFYEKTFVINERRYYAVLVIAYIMGGFGTLFELSSMLYSTWKNRKLEREEQRQN